MFLLCARRRAVPMDLDVKMKAVMILAAIIIVSPSGKTYSASQ